MLKSASALVWLLCCAAVSAATVQLKEKAAITGKILVEKPDQVVVDISYTTIVIPRAEITKILEDGAPVDQASNIVLKPNAPVAVVASLASVQPISSPAPSTGFYSAASTPGNERSVRELVTRLGEAVVQVRTPAGLGSGFFINEDGYLVTNFHVTEGETQISVEVYHQKGGQLERKAYKQVRIVALNKFADLALLKIEDKDAPRFVRAEFGNSDALAVGERVFAIGSPLGLERTVTEGIVSTTTRQIQGDLYIQTTAQINPGNSGGPLFNLRGEVIGVTNMKISFGEGLGFAIPIEQVKFFLNHRDSFSYENDNPSNAYHYLEPPGRTRKSVSE